MKYKIYFGHSLDEISKQICAIEVREFFVHVKRHPNPDFVEYYVLVGSDF